MSHSVALLRGYKHHERRFLRKAENEGHLASIANEFTFLVSFT